MPELNVIDATPAERAGIRGFQDALSSRPDADRSFGVLAHPSGLQVPIPEPLCRVLMDAAAALVAGFQVIVAPLSHRLTTQEAADLLNVSRPHLIKLLDGGAIPFEKVGRHRRVTFGDLMAYKKDRMIERRRELQNLVEESEELGLYERPGP